MTGEVEERQGEPAAENSIEARAGGEPPAGPVEPEEEAQGQETGGESVYACATVLTVSCCHFFGVIYL